MIFAGVHLFNTLLKRNKYKKKRMERNKYNKGFTKIKDKDDIKRK